MSTYDVPRISEVTVCPHEEAHGNDLEYHFNCVNHQEDEINLVGDCRHATDLLVDGEEEAVSEDYAKDDPIEPWINRDNLNDPVPERVRHREATQRNSCVILLLRVFATSFKICPWIVWESVFDGLHRLTAELTKRKASDLQLFERKGQQIYSK